MNLTAKKKFGQNFLINENMQKRFVEVGKRVFAQNNLDVIVEIGPGRGDLTKHLLQDSFKVFAFDIDPDAINFNKEQFQKYPNFQIFHLDALQDLGKISSFLNNEKFLFFSNLPFNVGSRILVDLPIEYPKTPAVVVLQKEVINKLKKNKQITFFGAWINLFYDVKFEFDIAAGNFFPAPKVVSTLCSLQPKNSWLGEKNGSEKQRGQKILKTLFTYPSKTLANNLKELEMTKEQIEKFLNQENLEKNTRLDWKNYEQILNGLLKFL